MASRSSPAGGTSRNQKKRPPFTGEIWRCSPRRPSLLSPLFLSLFSAMLVALLLGLHGASAFLAGGALSSRPSAAVSRVQPLAMVAKQTPHGGKLVDLFVEDKEGAKAAADITVELTDRQSCDVELLCNGGFSPLTGFMNEDEYNSVVEDMKLPSGLIFGLPVVMDTNDANVKVGSKLLLTYQVRASARRTSCKPGIEM